jgi:hypothetical protein
MALTRWIVVIVGTLFGTGEPSAGRVDRELLGARAELLDAGEESVFASLSGHGTGDPDAIVGAMPGVSPATWEELAFAAMAEVIVETRGQRPPPALAALFAALPPLARTYTVTSWALSPRDSLRLAVALYGCEARDTVGLHSAVAHLASDRSGRVRSAARRACAHLARA